jgi:putative NADH-flavin reductase
MMKLVVLGASGGCGRLLVTQAAARGHAVTAVARASSRLDVPDGVRALRGALDDEAFLREALRGADAALSALGLRLPGIAPWSRPEDPAFLDRSTPAVVRAMKAEGVRRAMVISAGGVGDSYDAVPGAFKMFIKASALRHVYPALERMERAWLESGLDVCVARPTGLTDEPATGRAKAVARVVGRAAIPRADVAAWMLDALEAPRFEARTPMLTVTGAP